MKTWRRQRIGMGSGNARSVLRSARTRRPVMTNVDDIPAMLKDEGVQLTFITCFKEIDNLIFHLAKRVKTGKT